MLSQISEPGIHGRPASRVDTNLAQTKIAQPEDEHRRLVIGAAAEELFGRGARI